MIEMVLTNLKALLGIKDNTQDSLLSIYAKESINRVLAYLLVSEEELGKMGLEVTLSFIAKDLYSMSNGGGGKIASVQESDRSITYATGTTVDGIISSYESVLRPYRKVKWNVCNKL